MCYYRDSLFTTGPHGINKYSIIHLLYKLWISEEENGLCFLNASSTLLLFSVASAWVAKNNKPKISICTVHATNTYKYYFLLDAYDDQADIRAVAKHKIQAIVREEYLLKHSNRPINISYW